MTKQIETLMSLAGKWVQARVSGNGGSPEQDALRQALEAALKPGHEADVWHEGSQSFYRAKLLYKLTPEEVDFSRPKCNLGVNDE